MGVVYKVALMIIFSKSEETVRCLTVTARVLVYLHSCEEKLYDIVADWGAYAHCYRESLMTPEVGSGHVTCNFLWFIKNLHRAPNSKCMAKL